jgi:two-component system chemotaxis response regulator CheY
LVAQVRTPAADSSIGGRPDRPENGFDDGGRAVQAMILDDSRAMRMILRRIMQSVGFDVLEASDGAEGLKLLESGQVPDVALVDWNMPNVDGLSFVSSVRANSDWKRIALMMVTTESEQGQIVKALAAGAHEYVIKPFTTEAILEKLNLLGLVPA